jgi:hypothetical protein
MGKDETLKPKIRASPTHIRHNTHMNEFTYSAKLIFTLEAASQQRTHLR